MQDALQHKRNHHYRPRKRDSPTGTNRRRLADKACPRLPVRSLTQHEPTRKPASIDYRAAIALFSFRAGYCWSHQLSCQPDVVAARLAEGGHEWFRTLRQPRPRPLRSIQ